MAYLDHNHSHKRLAGVTGVALVHIVLALGLTAGLAIDYIRPAPPPPFEGGQIPLPPPPPPDTREQPDPVDPRVPPTAPERPVDLNLPPPLPPVPPTPTDEQITYTGGTDIPLPTPPQPPEPPRPPLVTPRGPVPANGPAGWVTTDDYPRIAISREYEGTTRYQVTVGSNGRVQGCSVVASSGFEVLDRTVCDRIERRARFRPGIDRNGVEVAGIYTGSVSWQLPD
ncbi:energy transducer TonB [Alteraurantiacibacter buctensis]|uniref:TonB family protein n=1 Tax=Alteraurantiacibacter buctensis TaxID=1503981 RepID=A0A844Z058_9SPHN|nr:energy transducer TonB [Alteraurantiacibacter buctensis]MXO72636.1 TonB family protein [Alteraurantiacibacter buctensis]